jgi:hypothetical protein
LHRGLPHEEKRALTLRIYVWLQGELCALRLQRNKAEASSSKGFQITERQQFHLRFEFFNMFNHTNFLAPVSTRSPSQFEVIQPSNAARIIQIEEKYVF